MAWTAEKLLTAIRDDKGGDCITEERLVMVTGLTALQVKNSACTLRRNGLLERIGKGCHKLTSAGNEALKAGAKLRSGPKGSGQTGCRVWAKETARVRTWRAMRLRRKFSVPELIGLVADESDRGDITSSIRNYVCALGKAGYLVELPRREPGASSTSNGHKRWWLQDEKDTGPQAPVWRVPQKKVYDPNTEETHDISAKEDEEVTA